MRIERLRRPRRPPRGPPSTRRGSRWRRDGSWPGCRRAQSSPRRGARCEALAIDRCAISPLTCATACDALAEISRLVAVTQLERLALAGGRARRHARPPARASSSVTSTSTVGLPASRESRGHTSMIFMLLSRRPQAELGAYTKLRSRESIRASCVIRVDRPRLPVAAPLRSRADERLVAGVDDHHAAFGDGVPASILSGIEADRARRAGCRRRDR